MPNEIVNFLTDACLMGGRERRCMTGTLYAHYLDWAKGREPLKRKTFVVAMRRYAPVQYGVFRFRVGHHRGFVGVAPRPFIRRYKDLRTCEPPAPRNRASRRETPPHSQVHRFLSDCCITGEQHRATSKQVYEAYFQWVLDHDEHAHTQRALIRRINQVFARTSVRYGPHQFPDGSIAKGYRGLGLRTLCT